MARAPKSPKAIDALKHDAATRRNIPTAEMESFFRREEDSAPMPPKHYMRARPLAEGETRTEEEPSVPELIWNGARITISDEQMAELAATGSLRFPMRNLSGAARTGRIGPTSSSTCRRSTFRRRSTQRRSSTT
jgi:hypothetical protein